MAAVAGRKVRVMGFAIGASGGANSVSLESTAGGTQLMGVVNLAANGQLVLPYAEAGWCEATAGQLLNLKLSAATAVGGTLIYVLVDG